jgi:multidrug efflux pump
LHSNPEIDGRLWRQAFAAIIAAELRRPLGTTIVGGSLLSQFVTLYTTPVI